VFFLLILWDGGSILFDFFFWHNLFCLIWFLRYWMTFI